MVDSVVSAFTPASWEIPEDLLSYEHFERVLDDLDWNSSPGYPYMLTHATNRQFFDVVDGKPSLASKQKVWDMVTNRLLDGSADPVRLFIKPEPHKQSKLDSYRYRLISSVSIIDQIIDHMLFGTLNKNMIKEHINVPSKVGWTPYTGGWKIVPAGRMVATDKSAWDWTVKEWLVRAEFSVRVNLCRNRFDEDKYRLWYNYATMRYKHLYYENVFVTSGGALLQQKLPGVVKSGCVNTIATNSIMQVIIHHVACLDIGESPRPLWSMGDDTLQYSQEDMQGYCKALSRYCKLKEYQEVTEFAGNRFEQGGIIEPLYKGKHAFTLLHVDPEIATDLCFAYSLLYHRSESKGFISLSLIHI